MTPSQETRTADRAHDAALWWVDHAKLVADLVTGAATRDAARISSAREALWGSIVRWGQIIGHPLASALMGDHVAATAFALSALMAGDRKASGAALDMALASADAQTRLYSADSVTFPTEAWRDAFVRHTARTFRYAASLIDGDMVGFEEWFTKAASTRDELATLWMGASSPPAEKKG